MIRGGRAIVVGGGIAGLLAARVLSDAYREVVIVDRDRFSDGEEARVGAPQGRHAHLLLERGRRVLEGFFPGIERELLGAGAGLYDLGRDLSFVSWAGEGVRYPSGIPFLAASRPFLEANLRRRVLELPNVRVCQGLAVVGLAGNASAVTGVRLKGGSAIFGELVVDACGRASRGPRWLTGIGVAPPAETVVSPFLGCASRIYAGPARAVWDHVGLVALGAPPRSTRGATVVPIEGGRYLVTLSGLNGDHPPAGDEEQRAFVRSLAIPGLADWIAAATPLGPSHFVRFDRSRLRHFEACPLPRGYLAIGDAVASLNPIHGQGLTTAALGAEVLASVLGDRPTRARLPGLYHRRLARALRAPWAANTLHDLRYPGTEGRRSFLHRFAHAYLDRLLVLGTRDPTARHAQLEVLGMTAPPSSLLRPGLALRALATAIPRRLARPHQLRLG